ncbi:MAG TPA: hypothetical protein VNH83_07715 [Bryobacteraceae bacterium]|nr:hypothetical protein [Bryobacteraceae bacterium]
MRPAGTIIFLSTALAASVAAAQTTRSFHLTQNETADQMNQIATLIRSTGGIQQIWADDLQRTVSVTGTSAQLDMAAWYIRQLDRAMPPPSPQDYQAGSDDMVRMFFLSHVSTSQQLQEVVTNLRAIIDVKRLFIYDTLHAVAIRGTGSQIAMATWLANQLDQAAGAPSPAPNDYVLSGDDVTHVFNLSNPRAPTEMYEMVTLIRSVADIQRIFTYSARKTIVVRTSPDHMALTAWLVKQLDRPASTPSVTVQYTLPSGPDNIIGVFYLPNPSRERLNKAATQVRTTALAHRLFTYGTLGALAVRGTVGQVATAEKIIEEMNQVR